MHAQSSAKLRAFVRRHTRIADVPDVPGLRLHVGDDVMALCQLTGSELGDGDPPLPYWAFPWAGGLAIARHLVEHPDEVAGRRVFDLGSGSGLCAIVAARQGAASVDAADVDPFADASLHLNAALNGARIGFTRRDVLDVPAAGYDVILAGDICYEETMSARMLRWLRGAAAAGTRVLIGDPGRAYLPDDLERIATYRVRTSRELESSTVRSAGVYSIPRPAGGAANG
jgi:predicted nicotinamide N-methyase